MMVLLDIDNNITYPLEN